ncbi:MAG: transposase, partial [Thermodesulfobacteriota bacterium]
LVEVIAFCLMPTHLHLILKQMKENGISSFMGNTLNSYTRSFNTKYKRKGPLWEGRFKSVLVDSDEQLLHLTRYLHLNPVTAYLVNKPEEWSASSYQEYVSKVNNNRICKFDDLLEIDPAAYREFVSDRVSYQRELASIKELLLH